MGNQSFVIDQVIKGNRITYTENATFDKKKARSYYLRGHFEFDANWTLTPDSNNIVNLHKVQNGEFSFLIFAP